MSKFKRFVALAKDTATKYERSALRKTKTALSDQEFAHLRKTLGSPEAARKAGKKIERTRLAKKVLSVPVAATAVGVIAAKRRKK